MWNKIKSFFSSKKEEDVLQDYMLIWGITEGPSTDDEGETWYVVGKVSVEDSVFFTNIYFDTFPEAYEMAKHFKTNFTPVAVRIGDIDEI